MAIYPSFSEVLWWGNSSISALPWQEPLGIGTRGSDLSWIFQRKYPIQEEEKNAKGFELMGLWSIFEGEKTEGGRGRERERGGGAKEKATL